MRVPALPSSRVSDDRTKRERDLATYYDQEAPDRSGRDIDPGRVARRTEFIELLRTELRTSVVEIGTGPGRDASAFVAAVTVLRSGSPEEAAAGETPSGEPEPAYSVEAA